MQPLKGVINLCTGTCSFGELITRALLAGASSTRRGRSLPSGTFYGGADTFLVNLRVDFKVLCI
jgi:hypothetical protein